MKWSIPVMILVGALLSIFFISNLKESPSTSSIIYTPIQEVAPLTSEGIVQRINHTREQFGREPLLVSKELNHSASLKAEDMVERNYWGHFAPDGTSPWVFIKQADYKYLRAGENLAKCYKSNAELVQAWVKSPEHFKNIIGDFKEMGLAMQQRSDGCILVVNHFGTKL